MKHMQPLRLRSLPTHCTMHIMYTMHDACTIDAYIYLCMHVQCTNALSKIAKDSMGDREAVNGENAKEHAGLLKLHSKEKFSQRKETGPGMQ